jgi:hypothetical protein
MKNIFYGSHHTVEQMEINEKNQLIEDAIKQLKPKKQWMPAAFKITMLCLKNYPLEIIN